MSDDDIPVLRDAVARRPRGNLNQEQVDEICDNISATAAILIDKLVAEALREVLEDAEQELRARLDERLKDELPALVEKTLREKLRTD